MYVDDTGCRQKLNYLIVAIERVKNNIKLCDSTSSG